MNIQTKKPASNNKDAARSVNSRSNATPDSDDSKNVFKESQVNKMTAQQYEKASDAIMEAIRTGKFIYDMSGNAR
jgi:hypothetical protein